MPSTCAGISKDTILQLALLVFNAKYMCQLCQKTHTKNLFAFYNMPSLHLKLTGCTKWKHKCKQNSKTIYNAFMVI